MKTQIPPKQWQVIRRLGFYITPYWPLLALGIGANIIFSGVDAGFTYLLKPFMDKGLVERDIGFIGWVPFVIFSGIMLRGVVSALGGYWMTAVARHVVRDFRQKVFAKLLQLPAKFYDQNTSGQVLSKILYDVEQIAQVSAEALTTLVQSVFLILGFLTVMFINSWELSLFFLATLPFVALIVRLTNKRIRRVSHAVQAAMGEVTEIAQEAIEGYKVVRIFGGQEYEINKFNRATQISRQRDMKVAVTKAINIASVQGIIAMGIAMIIYLAIWLTEVILITPGGFFSIVAAMLLLVKPLKNLTAITSVIQRGLAGAESVLKLLDEAVEIDTGSKIVSRVDGNITFDQVNFAYQDSNTTLADIDFTIQSGETVAIVGRSGSGKTTLVSLLARFYEPTDGKILLDGEPLDTYQLTNLREQIALVSQQVTLFNDSIANNIAYGMAEKVTRCDIERAAEAAHVCEFTDELPHGLDTEVGENGVLLSGGQRQRIAIARAILKDAPILILDEATSALDTASERLIQSALDTVMKNRTTVVIAHRLSTVENADRVIVMDSGSVIETGTHKTLLQEQGAYAQLHAQQFQATDRLV